MKQLRISGLSAAGKRRTTLCTTCLAKQSAQRDRRGAPDASALEKEAPNQNRRGSPPAEPWTTCLVGWHPRAGCRGPRDLAMATRPASTGPEARNHPARRCASVAHLCGEGSIASASWAVKKQRRPNHSNGDGIWPRLLLLPPARRSKRTQIIIKGSRRSSA